MNIEVRPIIGVVGKGHFKGKFQQYEECAEQIGKEIACKGYWLLCGGLAGVMEAAARGAREAEGLTIGILPKAIANINDGNKSKAWPSSHIDIAIFTGLGGGIRRQKEDGSCTCGRNVVIVNSCDAIIALPGSNKTDKGTRSEIDCAIECQVPVVLHRFWETVSNPGPIPESGLLVQYYDTAEDAVEKAVAAIKQRELTIKLTTSRRKPPHNPHDDQASAEAKNHLIELNELILQAEEAGLQDNLASHLHQDFTIIRAKGKMERRQEFLDAAPGNKGLGRSADMPEVRLYGDYAVVTVRVTTLRKPDGTLITRHFWNTRVFLRQKGEWRCVAWQVTEIPDS
ncbi:MAG: DUF4440 domain-containing protein [Anaerolineae bacterium]|nr:DUF4440 domain-containing protein [Anaerolineae bacterium]